MQADQLHDENHEHEHEHHHDSDINWNRIQSWVQTGILYLIVTILYIRREDKNHDR